MEDQVKCVGSSESTPKEDTRRLISDVKVGLGRMLDDLNDPAKAREKTRALSIVKTKLEEAYMWANVYYFKGE